MPATTLPSAQGQRPLPDLSDRTLLISGACGVTSRTLVRALRQSPAFARTRLIGTDICDNPFGVYEGLYERVYRVPRLTEPDAYLHWVQHICRTERVDAALVVPEPEVLFWANHAMPVPSLLPPPGFAQIAISKARLHAALADTPWLPSHVVLSRAALLAGVLTKHLSGPAWLRDVGEGSTSGKGALCVRSQPEVEAWLTLNPDTRQFMVSQLLPGRNLACLLLYQGGRLLKLGCYERLEYFMAKTVLSGVTGNISQGRLINDEAAVAVATQAVARLCAQTGETMQGLVTVDMRCDEDDRPRITEINLRQVAAASAFATVPGANLAEAQALATLGLTEHIGPVEVRFPPRNRLLRDIDGLPLFVPDFEPLAVGAAWPPQRA